MQDTSNQDVVNNFLQEIPNLLRAVRPGGGFQFKGDLFEKVSSKLPLLLLCIHNDDNKFDKVNGVTTTMFKVDVNGNNEHPIFKHLKAALPLPQVSIVCDGGDNGSYFIG